jgi:hypothetical protein
METIKPQLQRLALYVSIIVCILFVLFVVNQTAQVVELASAASPLLGQVVLYALLALYAALVAIPVITLARLPGAIVPPADPDSPEYAAYLKKLAPRLAANSHLAGYTISADDPASLIAGLAQLDRVATEAIQSLAATVFISTAVSQSGRLDAIMVLLAQARMVTRIAQIYYERPTLRQVAHLYANVGATTFLVREIEDLDISEQIEPIITAALTGSLAGAVPGASIAANLLTNSILEGTANAFLTLRVGAIARQYCGSLIRQERRLVRRSASVEAAAMLGGIVVKSAGAVTTSIANAARKAGIETMSSLVDGVSKGTRDFAQRLGAAVGAIHRAEHPESDALTRAGDELA